LSAGMKYSMRDLICEKQSYNTPGSGCRWRHFYLDSPITAHCELAV